MRTTCLGSQVSYGAGVAFLHLCHPAANSVPLSPPPPAIPTGPAEPPLFYPDDQRTSFPIFEPLLASPQITCSKLHKAGGASPSVTHSALSLFLRP